MVGNLLLILLKRSYFKILNSAGDIKLIISSRGDSLKAITIAMLYKIVNPTRICLLNTGKCSIIYILCDFFGFIPANNFLFYVNIDYL